MISFMLASIPVIVTVAIAVAQAIDLTRRADRMHGKAREVGRLLGVEPEPESPPTGMPWRLRWFGWRLTIGGLLGLPLPKSADRP